MLTLRHTLLPAALLCSSLATADTYQFELEGFYTDSDWIYDSETLGASGTFFFAPVDDSRGPLGEAAFLNMASSIGLSYADIEIDGPGAVDGDGDHAVIEGRFVDTTSRLIIEAAYGSGDVEGSDIDQFHVAGGWYLDDVSSLLFSFNKVDNDVTGDVDTFAADWRRVTPLSGGDNVAIDATLAWTDSDTDDAVTLAVGADWYFTREASIGGSFGFVSGDDSDAVVYGLRGEVFLSNALAISAAFDLIDYDDIDEDERFTLGVRGRF